MTYNRPRLGCCLPFFSHLFELLSGNYVFTAIISVNANLKISLGGNSEAQDRQYESYREEKRHSGLLNNCSNLSKQVRDLTRQWHADRPPNVRQIILQLSPNTSVSMHR
ncbi:MAG: hypothetical protein LZF86_160039 [Nitrospira sp.]|nr:MAG: hypothetical protein LZF86_160039 [Nitrospira sp.]